ncbi:hypothetical protein [Streptomyces orinoci]|uniref:Uncharacterized protein n=1 Tax=Streptomyces orinoci TaxID=67339 RepID=A0ABV3JUJ9_STRON|nr:hypothetical protein [Streptomyces orinoci]
MLQPVSQIKPEQLADHYANLARVQFDLHNARGRLDFGDAGEASEPQVAPAATLSEASAPVRYDAHSSVFGFLGFAVVTKISSSPAISMHCGGGGLIAGGGDSWGSVWLNYPPEVLLGWKLRFEANMATAAVNINWWGMSGEYVGSYAGGGLSSGLGAAGGKGDVEGG